MTRFSKTVVLFLVLGVIVLPVVSSVNTVSSNLGASVNQQLADGSPPPPTPPGLHDGTAFQLADGSPPPPRPPAFSV
ncbi:MAG: hypothetical protein LAN71_01800 [Acidobacteriia bacterium]|nr:hypothetical protein [Terriglobia bacterium]